MYQGTSERRKRSARLASVYGDLIEAREKGQASFSKEGTVQELFPKFERELRASAKVLTETEIEAQAWGQASDSAYQDESELWLAYAADRLAVLPELTLTVQDRPRLLAVLYPLEERRAQLDKIVGKSLSSVQLAQQTVAYQSANTLAVGDVSVWYQLLLGAVLMLLTVVSAHGVPENAAMLALAIPSGSLAIHCFRLAWFVMHCRWREANSCP